MVFDPMKRRLLELDGLRGIAVLMVVFGHAQGTLPHGYSGWLSPLLLLTDADMGVRVFFILSGFLITSILMAEYDWSGTICLIDFYKRRILRIFPAFYAYLFFITGLSVTGVLPISAPLLLFAATFMLNYVCAGYILLGWGVPDGLFYAAIGHFWTLSLEEQFYWIWPLALIFVLGKRAFVLVPALLCVIPLIRIATYFLCPGVRGQLAMMFHTGSDVILFGCLLAIYSIRYPDWFKRLILPSWAVGLQIFLIWIVLPRIEIIVPTQSFHVIWAAINYTVDSLLLTLVIANVLLQPEAIYTRLLRNRILVFIGTISYSLYLWQQLFCYPMHSVFNVRFPLNVLLAMGMGYLSYRFIERPFLQVKEKRYGHLPPAGGP